MKKSNSSDPPAELPPINGPEDVKNLPMDRLDDLAAEVRRVLITSLARTGGHLGPNLGVTELSIALHRVFDTPADKFFFDVSHQGYVHKMLTGRWNEIDSIRTYKGLNGFLLRTESEHDCYGAGHAGTALSAALGTAVARDLSGEDNHVVAVAGDAAFTCGPTFEALNNISEATKKFIVVLNDNEWSIAKNVGAISKYFNKITTSKTYSHLHDAAANFVEKLMGKGMRRLAAKFEEGAKNLIVPSVIFEEFGLRYFGPIDGHDIPLLVKTFEFLKTQDAPVLLHIITEKGRGYEPALAKPDKFHGLGQYSIETGETAPRQAADLLRAVRHAPRGIREAGQEDHRDHRRHAGRFRARKIPGRRGGCGALLSTSASPRNTPPCSPAVRRSAVSNRSSRSTRPSCSAPTTC